MLNDVDSTYEYEPTPNTSEDIFIYWDYEIWKINIAGVHRAWNRSSITKKWLYGLKKKEYLLKFEEMLKMAKIIFSTEDMAVL